MDEEQEQVQQQSAGYSFLTNPTDQPLYITQQYKYQPKTLPPKPKVLLTGENLAAPVASGVDFAIEQS
jgi:hypothetical protein